LSWQPFALYLSALALSLHRYILSKINDEKEGDDDDGDDDEAECPSGKRSGGEMSGIRILLAAPLDRRRCCRRPLIIRTACGVVRATR